MKRAVIIAVTIILFFIYPISVWANISESAVSIKLDSPCYRRTCINEYAYYLYVSDLKSDVDAVFVEFSDDNGQWTPITTVTRDLDTGNVENFTIGLTVVAGDGHYRVTAFLRDRGVRMIPVQERLSHTL